MNKKPCGKCGVARNVMVKGDVFCYSGQNIMGLVWLCIPCFLRVIGIRDQEFKKISKDVMAPLTDLAGDL